MPTKAEIAKALKTNAEEIEKTDKALKKATDLRAPKGAKKAAAHLRHVLRKVRKGLFERRKTLKEKREGKTGIGAALAWSKSVLGYSERPAGSNLGPGITEWERETGYAVPDANGQGVPWCGCFAREFAERGGVDIPIPVRWGYSGYLAEDARAGRNGFEGPVSAANVRAGDIGAVGTSHVVVAIGPAVNGYVRTREGNTSPGDEGSQYNGGTVAEKTRPVSMVTTWGRPRYA